MRLKHLLVTDRWGEQLVDCQREIFVLLAGLQMLQQGFAPDSADYDGRRALMLAAVKGHSEVGPAAWAIVIFLNQAKASGLQIFSHFDKIR